MGVLPKKKKRIDRSRTTWTGTSINPQPTDWRTHTQINRPIGGQTHRSTDRSADRPSDQPTDRRTDNRSTDRSADRATNQPTDQLTTQPIYRPMGPINRTMGGPRRSTS